MKKIIFVLSMITGLGAFAKEPITDKKLMLGFNLGTSANTAYFENENKNNPKNRTKVGGFAAFTLEGRIADHLSLETGVNFVNKGASQRWEKSLLFKSGSTTVNLNSIEIPLIVKWYIGKKKIFNINGGGFFSYAYLINQVTKAEPTFGDKINKKESVPQNPKGDKLYKPIDAGINLGFEFISQKGFGAGLKVNQGFINGMNKKYFTNRTSPLPAPDKKMFNTGAQLYFIAKF